MSQQPVVEQQLDLFPDALPEIVVRVWRAARLYYATGTRITLTREVLKSYLEKDAGRPASLSTIDRARRAYAALLPWPITLQMAKRPPWLGRPELLASVTDWSILDPSEADPEELFVLVEAEPPFVIRECNDAACRVSGRSRDELRGAPAGLMLRPGQPFPFSRACAVLKACQALVRAGEREQIRWESHWQHKGSQQRINLLVRQCWDAESGCWAMSAVVVPHETRDGRVVDDDAQVREVIARLPIQERALEMCQPGRLFGTGPLVAASLLVACCANFENPLHHLLRELLGRGVLLGGLA